MKVNACPSFRTSERTEQSYRHVPRNEDRTILQTFKIATESVTWPQVIYLKCNFFGLSLARVNFYHHARVTELSVVQHAIISCNVASYGLRYRGTVRRFRPRVDSEKRRTLALTFGS